VKIYMERYEYKGWTNTTGVCGIEVFGTTVICTQFPENRGTSITNMAESLAAQISEKYSIPLHDLIWIEHYPADALFAANYKVVAFDMVQGRVLNPRWQEIEPQAVDLLKNEGLKKKA
jgi:hypothetical protein